ncbi:unnamed protein product [Lampetra planeri]
MNLFKADTGSYSPKDKDILYMLIPSCSLVSIFKSTQPVKKETLTEAQYKEEKVSSCTEANSWLFKLGLIKQPTATENTKECHREGPVESKGDEQRNKRVNFLVHVSFGEEPKVTGTRTLLTRSKVTWENKRGSRPSVTEVTSQVLGGRRIVRGVNHRHTQRTPRRDTVRGVHRQSASHGNAPGRLRWTGLLCKPRGANNKN